MLLSAGGFQAVPLTSYTENYLFCIGLLIPSAFDSNVSIQEWLDLKALLIFEFQSVLTRRKKKISHCSKHFVLGKKTLYSKSCLYIYLFHVHFLICTETPVQCKRGALCGAHLCSTYHILSQENVASSEIHTKGPFLFFKWTYIKAYRKDNMFIEFRYLSKS